MANIERRRDDDAHVPGPAGQPAERFVRAIEQISIDAARRQQHDARHSTTNVPPAQQSQSGQPAPTIIYINNSTSPASNTAPVSPPTEVHYHTTVYENARGGSSSRYRRKTTSAFGMAAVILGLVSCVACWVSGAESVAFPVGVLGVGLGALGWLISLLLGRTGAALPVAGAFISAVGIVISIVGKDAAKPILDQLKARATDVVQEGKKLLPAESVKENSKDAPSPKMEPGPTQTKSGAPHSIAPPAQSTPSAPNTARVVAQAHMDGATAAVDARLAHDNAYQTAGLLLEQDEAEVQRLRDADKTGTPEMTLAARRALDARARVKQLRDAALDTDAAVTAARNELNAASK